MSKENDKITFEMETSFIEWWINLPGNNVIMIVASSAWNASKNGDKTFDEWWESVIWKYNPELKAISRKAWEVPKEEEEKII